MDDNLQGQVQQKSLITDQYYYKHIFKKTEKIVSAVFFIVSKRQNIPQDNVVRADLERRAKDAHSVALSLLNLEPEAAGYGMQTLLHSLVSLDSILRIFAAMGGISEDNLRTITAEIEGVQRSMRRYLGEGSFVLATEIPTPRKSPTATPTQQSLPTTVAASTTHVATAQHTQSRTDRILNVLKDGDGVGIKDIASVIHDCSEKTIQRELMSLIESGLIRREGERRWSRYFVV